MSTHEWMEKLRGEIQSRKKFVHELSSRFIKGEITHEKFVTEVDAELNLIYDFIENLVIITTNLNNRYGLVMDTILKLSEVKNNAELIDKFKKEFDNPAI